MEEARPEVADPHLQEVAAVPATRVAGAEEAVEAHHQTHLQVKIRLHGQTQDRTGAGPGLTDSSAQCPFVERTPTRPVRSTSRP